MKRPLLPIALLLMALPAIASANVHLLGSPQVRAELHIPHPLAVRMLHNLNEAARLSSGGLMSREHARTLQETRKLTPPEVLERQVLSCLSPSQKQRLEQIELQRAGPFLFEDWQFAKRVGFSSNQYRYLQSTYHTAFQRYMQGIQSLSKANARWFGILDRQRYASKYATYYQQFNRLGQQRKTAVELALARSLTPRQKTKWRTLLGKPFRTHLTYDTKSYSMD